MSSPRKATLGCGALVVFAICVAVTRRFSGDPGAVREVNAAADWFIATKSVSELEAFADALLKEYSPRSAESTQTDSVPPERLAEKFWKLSEDGKYPPTEIWLRRDRTVDLYWARFASASYDVLIFEKEPAVPPKGFFGRRISPRVYIVYASGNRRYDDVPATDARHRPE